MCGCILLLKLNYFHTRAVYPHENSIFIISHAFFSRTLTILHVTIVDGNKMFLYSFSFSYEYVHTIWFVLKFY
jgi:hypothetical protein